MLGLLASFAGCSQNEVKSADPMGKVYFNWFDTVSYVYSYAGDPAERFEQLSAGVSGILTEYHQLFDIYHEYSGINNLCTINRQAGGDPLKVDPKLIEFLLYAEDLYRKTDGEMNILLGPVLKIWHNHRTEATDNPGAASLPAREELLEAAKHTAFDLLEINPQQSTVRLVDSSAAIDVGALGKGYATEKAAEYLQQQGAGSYVLNIGGNIRIIGTKPDGSGEAYSLGSKFYTNTGDDSYPVLYCIWSEGAPESDFTFENYTMTKPSSAKYAPDWCESGVIITAYSGNADSVTVPETLGGKKVIAIAAGAFNGKNMTELLLPKTLQLVENGAFVNCSSLNTMYLPSSIYQIYDEAFDAATYSSFKTLILSATMAPRDSHSTDGAFAVKFCRFLAARDKKKVIVISGSSTYQGLATEYMEALFDGEYTVINFGTTRPRPGLVYLEALSHYTNEDDIFVYAPENSSYMMGEGYLSWRIIRNLEGMNNLYRYFDISNYYGYFSSITELNQDYGYTAKERKYEEFCRNGYLVDGEWCGTDKNGDYQHPHRDSYLNESKYIDSYYITLNNRYKSMNEGTWNNVEEQAGLKDYTDPNNPAWRSIDTPELVARMNFVINKAKSSGSKVYFGFAPADAYALVEAARNTEWILNYRALILDLYDFDGLMGSALDYVYNHKYFYDCAFHVNDYGRAYRTYNLYLDIAEKLGLEEYNGFYSKGTDFDGCLFEEGSDGTPLEGVDFLN